MCTCFTMTACVRHNDKLSVTYKLTQIYTHTHTHTHTYTHTQSKTHTYTHTFTNAHTHLLYLYKVLEPSPTALRPPRGLVLKKKKTWTTEQLPFQHHLHPPPLPLSLPPS